MPYAPRFSGVLCERMGDRNTGLHWEGRGFESLPVFAEAPSGAEGEVEGCHRTRKDS
jgi:hypothetical protein